MKWTPAESRPRTSRRSSADENPLGGGEGVDQVGASVAVGGEAADPAREAEAVVADRPGSVLGPDQGGIEPLEVAADDRHPAGVESAPRARSGRPPMAATRSSISRQRSSRSTSSRTPSSARRPASTSSSAAAGRSERGDPGGAVGRGRRRSERGSITQRGERAAQSGQDFFGLRGRAGGLPQDSDNSAHDQENLPRRNSG